LQDMVRLQADRVSIPAQAFVDLLARATPPDPTTAAAQAYLREWDGAMEPDSVAATLYAVCRERAWRVVIEPLLGSLARPALGGGPYGALMPLSQLRARLLSTMQADDRSLLPEGTDWSTVLSEALSQTVTGLRERLGDDMAQWHWGRLHRTAVQHP